MGVPPPRVRLFFCTFFTLLKLNNFYKKSSRRISLVREYFFYKSLFFLNHINTTAFLPPAENYDSVAHAPRHLLYLINLQIFFHRERKMDETILLGPITNRCDSNEFESFHKQRCTDKPCNSPSPKGDMSCSKNNTIKPRGAPPPTPGGFSLLASNGGSVNHPVTSIEIIDLYHPYYFFVIFSYEHTDGVCS